MAWARPRFIDVYRPVNGDGTGLDPTQQQRVAENAMRWVGWPFARAKIVWLALQTLLHHEFGRLQSRLPTPDRSRCPPV